MSLALILFTLLSGCSLKHITFQPTGSPCLDAVVAHFSDAKCQEIEEEGSWGGELKLYCSNPKKRTEWTERDYYVISPLWGGFAPDDVELLCADEGLIVLHRNGREE